MKISVELTFSPLQTNYAQPVVQLIKKLRDSGLIIKETPLSTQLYGDYEQVMQVLTTEIRAAFELIDMGLMYVKIVKTDLHDYEPYF